MSPLESPLDGRPGARPPNPLVLRSLADRPDLEKACTAIENESWSTPGFLYFSASFRGDYFALLRRYNDHQLCLVDDDSGFPKVFGNSVPVPFVAPSDLPDEGWDWVVGQARARAPSTRRGDAPLPVDPGQTMLAVLAISIPSLHRSSGIARRMFDAFRDLARSRGYRSIVAPARPTAKIHHPWVPIEEYLTWTDSSGRSYDPWLRSHLAAGGRVAGVCPRSMVVDEPLGFWEIWSQRRFERSGQYLLPGCLVPIDIDVEAGRGRYVEPGIWVVYDL